MRSLVHGPVDLVVADAGDPAPLVGWYAAAWVDGWGMLAIVGPELVLVQLTGRAVRLGARRAWYGVGWSHDDRPCAGDAWRKVHIPSTRDLGAAWSGPTGTIALMQDRALAFNGANVTAAPVPGPGGASLEAAIFGTPGGGSIVPYDLRAGRQLWWVINLSTTQIALYDAVAKAEVAGRRSSLGGGALRAFAYSRALGLFLAVRRDSGRGVDQLYAYADEPVAATVTAPTFSAPPRAGALRTVRSQVVGSDQEPCPERVVTFSATAGSFDQGSVATDAGGWAEAIYRAPGAPVTGAGVTATLVE